MNNLKYLLLMFSLLCSFNIVAKIVRLEWTGEIAKKSTSVVAYYFENYDRLEVKSEGELKIELSYPYLSEGFKHFEIFSSPDKSKQWLVSYWRKGVHGEHIVVIDLKDSKVIYDETSSWPMKVLRDEKGVTLINYAGKKELETRLNY